MGTNTKSTRRAREIAHTRRDILEAAGRVFAQAGFHDATMQEIAREVGFTAASLYTYFASKDELYEALLEELSTELLATFDARVPAGLTFAQRLELLLHRQMELTLARRDAIRVMFDLGPRRSPQACARPSEYLRRLGAFMESFGADALRCPADEAARLLFGMAHFAFLPVLAQRGDLPIDPAREIERLVDLFLHGAAVSHPR